MGAERSEAALATDKLLEALREMQTNYLDVSAYLDVSDLSIDARRSIRNDLASIMYWREAIAHAVHTDRRR